MSKLFVLGMEFREADDPVLPLLANAYDDR